MSALAAKLRELPAQVALLARLALQQRAAPTPGFICGVAALAAWAVLPAAEPAKAQMRASGLSARTARALLDKDWLLQHLQVCGQGVLGGKGQGGTIKIRACCNTRKHIGEEVIKGCTGML